MNSTEFAEDATNAAAFGASVRMNAQTFVAHVRTSPVGSSVNVHVAAQAAAVPLFGAPNPKEVN